MFRLSKNGDVTVSDGVIVETSDMTESEFKVYETILKGEVFRLADISEASGVSVGTVRRSLAKLVEKGYIRRIGGDRSGKWVSAKSLK